MKPSSSPRTVRPRKSVATVKPRPRIELRLSDEEQAELQKKASKAKMPLATFSREMLLAALEREDSGNNELVARMIALEDALSEFRGLFEETSGLVNRLCMASIASSALLRDDGKETKEVASRAILDHIDEAMRVAPGLLKHHAK